MIVLNLNDRSNFEHFHIRYRFLLDKLTKQCSWLFSINQSFQQCNPSSPSSSSFFFFYLSAPMQIVPTTAKEKRSLYCQQYLRLLPKFYQFRLFWIHLSQRYLVLWSSQYLPMSTKHQLHMAWRNVLDMALAIVTMAFVIVMQPGRDAHVNVDLVRRVAVAMVFVHPRTI